MSHHYSGPDWGFPKGDACLDLTDLYAFPRATAGHSPTTPSMPSWLSSQMGR
jgi:hypothetical protein